MPGESLTATNDINLPDAALADAVSRAGAALQRRQKPDGHWVFELEADATIPAEFVLLQHFLDRTDAELERKIGTYLRSIQGAHGGWPLFHDGAFDISASVKAYFALKVIGDDPDAPHMRRAREAILAAGGAERTNVFTRAQLALYGEVPWRGVPVMPVEIMILPKWFPFHLDKVSYWSRTVIVPLLVLMALKPRARNPRGVRVQELFRTPPEQVRDWIRGPYRSGWGRFFKHLDSVLRVAEPLFPAAIRRRAVAKAVDFITVRLNGEDGLGGIYPAMANAVMMFDTLGYAPDHPDAVIAWASVNKLLVVEDGRAYCQPCLSPVWDTALAGHALAETDGAAAPAVDAANGWLRGKQILDVVGDWKAARPHAPPGGWAFQYENPHYPDVDDTAVVGMLLHRQMEAGQGEPDHAGAIARARDWIVGMQSRDGGWGAFDADNDKHYLNHIPFADHGALLDPPTADVTARCVSFLAQLGHAAEEPVMARALAWLRREQEQDGSWFGRWGTNYIYGTWSVLCAFNAAGVASDDPSVRKAVAFLLDTQREDGGWGEDNESYAKAPRGRYHRSNPSQTAWALLGLMAAGEADNPAVARGVAWLAAQQKADGEWDEEPYTAVGFPRVFYLRYHGYRLFFPLLAMARYRNLKRSNDRRVAWGF
ncbi:squalene--hopene cyclase [Limobrevibacterium gyesilva]|uniref:Squalene--hopene cyclase n=1 Tax=Limobrevibacterium gyesilva TaxID=2991712 RepID=A0AA41YKT8_9PROT|nr:squalene--hopene cyclase [Limobrevibacterium gyesilva]MCW3473728.1 squalene--hopene cyclase [Limobrevibacterium gyesilva]